MMDEAIGLHEGESQGVGMSLTGRDKRRLKARGQTMADDVRLGQEGLTEGFVANLNGLLSRKELVKLRFGEIRGQDRRDLADAVASAVQAQCVAVLGRTMLLYRANESLPMEQRVLGAGGAGDVMG